MKLKSSIFIIAVVLTSACSAIKEDPWGWLEQPEEQAWKKVSIDATGRLIEFSIPDLAGKWGNHVAVWPENGLNETVYGYVFPEERLFEPFTLVATFTWDSWWGGFYKKGGEDFYLSVGVQFIENNERILSSDLDRRVQQASDYWVSLITEPDGRNRTYRKFFADNLRVEPYINENGLEFVDHNAPRVSGEHREFTIPISNHHVLEFSFYVSELRFDREEDPQWNQSRWELVEQIMKTVRITPDPFGDQPEEVPAR